MRQQLYYSDLVALVSEFQSLVGARLQKVYNVGQTHLYLLKLQVGTEKIFMGLQGGKFVLTLKNPPQQRPKLPSSFCQKLRRHLSNCRLTKVSTLNKDRIIDLTFGSEGYAHHLIIELYGDGNVVLTDFSYKVLSFIYPQRYQGRRIKVQTNYLEYLVTRDIPEVQPALTLKEVERNLLRQYGKDISKETVYSLKRLDTPTISAEVCGVHLKIVLNRLINREPQAYTYQTMCNPIPYQYLTAQPVTATYPTFSEALEHYLAKYLGEPNPPIQTGTTVLDTTQPPDIIPKQSQQLATMTRMYQEKVANLTEKYQSLTRIIQYLVCHPDQVQAQLQLAQANPTQVIGSQHIYHWVTGAEVGTVKLRGRLSYYDNLTELYQTQKTIQRTIDRTHLGHTKAITKFKLAHQSAPPKLVVTKLELMKGHWYHNFHWMFTSNGYLVICGKNSSQNETVVKKYLEDHDIYLHSEVAGCGSAVLKVPVGCDPTTISPTDLEEAGAFVICLSRAWRDKVPDRAYWTLATQVSKTTETGEYVQKGSFIIRGRRNYLSQIRLELGVAIYQGQLMLAPYRRLAQLSAVNKLKIIPGKSKRNQGLQKILTRLQLATSEKATVDSIVPHNSQII